MSERSLSKDKSDKTLIEESLNGNVHSFGVVVEKYWRMAFAIAYVKTSDSAAAEDIAQQCFFKAFLHLSTLREHSRFCAWLRRIIEQECALYHREKGRVEVRTNVSNEILERRSSMAAKSNPGLTKKQRDFLREAVRSLPDKYQKALTMRFFCNMSCLEIAKQLGRRSGTVRVWLHRGCKMLRERLGPLYEQVS